MSDRTSGPVVSVIVPARNEEASLGACLSSLAGQQGIAFEIIVVDDASTDRTRHIAESFPGVRVIAAAPPPQGWTGKNNAVASGARAARGEWLLFTDADTVHLPGSLARSLREAEDRGAALLSYSPAQEVRGFWEKAIMPVIFAELARTYRPRDVCDPTSPVAAANGQYLLISRALYDAIGGHAAVAASLLEDVELARLVKSSGHRIYFRFGGDAVRTRMYRSFSQLREGWTKNLALLFASPERLALRRAAEFLLIIGSLAITALAAYETYLPGVLVGATVFVLSEGRFLARIRRAHFPWDSSLLAVFGLPLFAWLLRRSRRAHQNRTVAWKGRTYPGQRPESASASLSDQPLFNAPEGRHGLSHS